MCTQLLGTTRHLSEKEMEKAMLTSRDILEQLFDDDSDISGYVSGGEEGKEVYAYCGPSFGAQLQIRTCTWTRQTHGCGWL